MGVRSFFCENCGTEVPPGADVCPGCLSEFSSVKCPRCGRSGKEKLFLYGCPFCGYLKKEKSPEPEIKEPVKRFSLKRFAAAFFILTGLLLLFIYLLFSP